MTKTSWKPDRRVVNGGFGGAVAAVVLWILDSGFGVDMPAGIVSAITVIITTSVAYLIPDLTKKGPPDEKPNSGDRDNDVFGMHIEPS
jgi:hypothetical protein